jgi:hypothetical protein
MNAPSGGTLKRLRAPRGGGLRAIQSVLGKERHDGFGRMSRNGAAKEMHGITSARVPMVVLVRTPERASGLPTSLVPPDSSSDPPDSA